MVFTRGFRPPHRHEHAVGQTMQRWRLLLLSGGGGHYDHDHRHHHYHHHDHWSWPMIYHAFHIPTKTYSVIIVMLEGEICSDPESFVGFKIPTTRGFWNLLMGYRWSSNTSQVWGKTEIKDCLDTSESFKRHHLYIKSSFFSSSFESLEPNRRYMKTALDFSQEEIWSF